MNSYNGFWSRRYGNAERVCKALEALGPTYVKFGQALASRADIIPPPLADALLRLQDDMEAFSSSVAQDIVRTELAQAGKVSQQQIDELLESLSLQPVAAASIGQVYKGSIAGYGDVAVKVKRPGIHQVVVQDAALLKTAATWVESVPGWNSDRLIAARVVDAVDEFMARIVEELDYHLEVRNMKTFGDLYSVERGTCKSVRVVVPNPIEDYCAENVIVMEWINGKKLDGFDGSDPDRRKRDLKVVEMGISCTLSQLLETGKLHADPHLGNLLRVNTPNKKKNGSGNGYADVRLGYLDFGLLATVPEKVRDGLVCAVVQLIFARNVHAVAALFGELQLLPNEVMEDPQKMDELAQALDRIFTAVLQFPDEEEADSAGRGVPMIRFDNLLGALTSLVASFQLTLPPYFLNNARALATLEGVAIRLDPSFNVLQVVYPFALKRVLANPSRSRTVVDTTMDLFRCPSSGLVELSRIKAIVSETSHLTGRSRRRVLADILSTAGGRQIARLATHAMTHQWWITSRVRRRFFGKGGDDK